MSRAITAFLPRLRATCLTNRYDSEFAQPCRHYRNHGCHHVGRVHVKIATPRRLCRPPIIIAAVAVATDTHIRRPLSVDASLGLLRKCAPCGEDNPCWTANIYLVISKADSLFVEYPRWSSRHVCSETVCTIAAPLDFGLYTPALSAHKLYLPKVNTASIVVAWTTARWLVSECVLSSVGNSRR